MICVSIFPYVPLTLDLPHYFRRNLIFVASTLAWFALPTYYLYETFTTDVFNGRVGLALMGAAGFGWVAVLVLAVRISFSCLHGRGTRAAVNGLYLGQIVSHIYTDSLWPIIDGGKGRCHYQHGGAPAFCWELQCIMWIYWVAASLFGVAAVICLSSWALRHGWVPSRALGGSGVESIVLMLPGRGPLYPTVGEPIRGAIRLV